MSQFIEEPGLQSLRLTNRYLKSRKQTEKDLSLNPTLNAYSAIYPIHSSAHSLGNLLLNVLSSLCTAAPSPQTKLGILFEPDVVNQ